MIGTARDPVTEKWTHIGPSSGAAVAARHRTCLLEKRGVRAALLLAPAFLFVFWRQFFIVTDTDYWRHVQIGEEIWLTGAMPSTIRTYIASGQPWMTHEWLTEVVLYLVQHWLGYVGNVVLFGVINTTTVLLVYQLCRRRGLGEVAAMLLALWAFAMSAASINVRPQMVTLLFVAVCALLLTRYREEGHRAIWLLPPLVVLWANLHGGYVAGLLLIGLTIVGEGFGSLRGRPAAPLRPLATVAVVSGVAPLLNPYGAEAMLFPFRYAGLENVSMQHWVEWQSPNFHDPSSLIFAASLLALIALGIARRPLGVSDLLWAAVMTGMALQSVRHVPLYAVVVMPLLGARLVAEVPALGRVLAHWRRPGLLLVLWPLVMIAAWLVAKGGAAGGLPMQTGRDPAEVGYPAGAVAYLRAHPTVTGGIFDEMTWGGYLGYQLYPRDRIFVDGWADVYGDRQLVKLYGDVMLTRPGWREALDRQHIDLVLVRRDSVLASALAAEPGWRELYAGDVEQLFARTAPHP